MFISRNKLNIVVYNYLVKHDRLNNNYNFNTIISYVFEIVFL